MRKTRPTWVTRTALLCLGLSFSTFLFAQFAPDTSATPATRAAISAFYAKLLPSALLYNGTEFQDYDTAVAGIPFYPDASLHTGMISYGGIRYSGVRMMYDVYKDRLVINSYNNHLLMPAMASIDTFYFYGRAYERLRPDTLHGFPGEGIYEVVYAGRVSLLARHVKTIQSDPRDRHKYFMDQTRYYLVRGGAYHAAGTPKALLELLSDHKKEMRQFIRQNNLRFEDNATEDMKSVITYYDQLITPTT